MSGGRPFTNIFMVSTMLFSITEPRWNFFASFSAMWYMTKCCLGMLPMPAMKKLAITP